MSLLSIDTNAKTVKGQKQGFLTGILYLAPSNESGVINVCPHASEGCRAACLFTAGRGRFDQVKNARLKKTLAFHTDRKGFVDQLCKDIEKLNRKAKRENKTPCVRLNGTSDLPWENFGIMDKFPNIQFYDYTKNFNRMLRYCSGQLPKNYHLTFSRSEENDAQARLVSEAGGNVAVVFSGDLPAFYLAPVINGDETDLRFLDPQGVTVGLKAKGDAKKDLSGFVVDTKGV